MVQATAKLVSTSTPLLGRLVEEVQVAGFVAGRPLEQVERWPDGTFSMLLRVTDGVASNGYQGDLSIAGPRTRALYKTVRPVPLSVGIRFRPGAAAAILGVPADELTDRIVRIDELWGAEGVLLRDRLLSAQRVEDMLPLLEAALHARANRVREPSSARIARRAVRLVAESTTLVRVGELAAKLGVSTRHLRRLFIETVGIGPKDFARVVRFQRAVFAARTARSWTTVAMDAGYYDQAHMIGDFQDLVDTTPRTFMGREFSYRW